jgi:hypothetical protein
MNIKTRLQSHESFHQMPGQHENQLHGHLSIRFCSKGKGSKIFGVPTPPALSAVLLPPSLSAAPF